MFDTNGPEDKLEVIVSTEEVFVIWDERLATVKLVAKGAIVADCAAADVVEFATYGTLVMDLRIDEDGVAVELLTYEWLIACFVLDDNTEIVMLLTDDVVVADCSIEETVTLPLDEVVVTV